jgi:CHAD domain-containing protein
MAASRTAYRIDPGRALSDELRGTARGQIDGALGALAAAEAEPEDAVHDLRKRMKKLRALLRLARPGLGETYKAETRAARDIARLFSGIRDAQVLPETVRGLAAETGDDGLAPLADWAARHRAATLADIPLPGRIAEARPRLEAARARVPGWTVAGGDRAVIREGLKQDYKRARKAWGKAAAHPDDPAQLHEWRKRMKSHRHHCRLLAGLRPEMMAARVEALHELTDALGADHDLAVLRALLDGDAARELPAATRRRAADLAREKGAALRERAFALAPRVLEEKPGALADRIAGTWPAAAAGA